MGSTGSVVSTMSSMFLDGSTTPPGQFFPAPCPLPNLWTALNADSPEFTPFTQESRGAASSDVSNSEFKLSDFRSKLFKRARTQTCQEAPVKKKEAANVWSGEISLL